MTVDEALRSIVSGEIEGEVSSVKIFGGEGWRIRDRGNRDALYEFLDSVPDSGEISIDNLYIIPYDNEVSMSAGVVGFVNYVTGHELGDPDNIPSFSVPWTNFVEIGRPMKLGRAYLYTNKDSEQ